MTERITERVLLVLAGRGWLLAAMMVTWSITGVVTAQETVPIGVEFQINTYTTGTQETRVGKAVSRAADGSFVVVWEGGESPDRRVFGRRFDSSGAPAGDEFQIDTYTTGNQRTPAVATGADGDFVVVWRGGYGQDGSEYGVFGQRFESDGAKVGTEFLINTYTTGDQEWPDVVAGADGDFVAVWRSYGQDGDDAGIFAQRFDSTGASVGGEFQVNTYTTGRQVGGKIAVDALGNFAVVWTDMDPRDGSGMGVFARRFDSTGTPVGDDFQVNTYTTDEQSAGEVAYDAEGNFIMVWRGKGDQDGAGSGIFAQRFDSTGASVGGEFQVNTYTTGSQSYPAVAFDANGRFLVVWTDHHHQDGDGEGIFAQRFDSTGASVGGEFQVNTYTTNSQDYPSVAAHGYGDFLVVWTSVDQDGDGRGVFGRRFTLCGDGILDTGQECDDGNVDDGDCCSSTCQFEEIGSPCEADANLCTEDRCDAIGNCVLSDTVACAACQTCDPELGCMVAPRSMCRKPVEPFKALLLLKDKSDDSKDKLIWKWIKGEETDFLDFGDPVTTDDYTLCIYEGPGAFLLFSVGAPAGGNCAGKACWKALGKNPAGSKGYKYKDKEQTPEGVDLIVLKPGDSEKAKVIVKGNGENLGLPSPLDVELPVTVQLQGGNGECWEAKYFEAGVKKSEADQFKAKAGSPSGAFLGVESGLLD